MQSKSISLLSWLQHQDWQGHWSSPLHMHILHPHLQIAYQCHQPGVKHVPQAAMRLHSQSSVPSLFPVPRAWPLCACRTTSARWSSHPTPTCSGSAMACWGWWSLIHARTWTVPSGEGQSLLMAVLSWLACCSRCYACSFWRDLRQPCGICQSADVMCRGPNAWWSEASCFAADAALLGWQWQHNGKLEQSSCVSDVLQLVEG